MSSILIGGTILFTFTWIDKDMSQPFDPETYLDELYEELLDSHDNNNKVNVEFDGKYLSIQIDGKEYLVHWHDVQKQMWFSSPVSGAHHFAYSDAKKALCSTRDSAVILEELLIQELGLEE